jgi:NTP pyrophosphatase (non-canonical NTP hydrolase)
MQEVMQAALDAFGPVRQTDKCLGEMAELADALLSHRHGEASREAVVDEVADVLITAGQMRLLFGADAVDARIAVKLSRLSQLVADQVASTKPEPKPEAAPTVRWREGGNDLTLYLGIKPIGMVELHRSGRWIGDPFGKASATSDDKGKAMRHVERVCGLPEVPVWKK